eukprot:717446-Prymnesium_polylepis.1
MALGLIGQPCPPGPIASKKARSVALSLVPLGYAVKGAPIICWPCSRNGHHGAARAQRERESEAQGFR